MNDYYVFQETFSQYNMKVLKEQGSLYLCYILWPFSRTKIFQVKHLPNHVKIEYSPLPVSTSHSFGEVFKGTRSGNVNVTLRDSKPLKKDLPNDVKSSKKQQISFTVREVIIPVGYYWSSFFPMYLLLKRESKYFQVTT